MKRPANAGGRPPRLARWLLSHLLPLDFRDEAIGDLDEEYRRHILPRAGAVAARAWYWRQAAGSLPRLAAHDFARDLRFGVRGLRRQPGFALTAIVTLALGIGVNTAIFSIANAVLLRPLPYAEPDRLVRIGEIDPATSLRRPASWPEYVAWRDGNRAFTGIAGYDGSSRTLTGVDGAERLAAAQVTDNFFHLLGVVPQIGRSFRPGESGRDAARVVVLTHSTWQLRFAGADNVVGETLVLNDVPHAIIGVLPASFEFSLRGSAELYLPLDVSAAEAGQRDRHWLDLIGRLDDEATLEAAEADLGALLTATAADIGDWHAGVTGLVVPLHEEIVAAIRPALLALLAAVAAVLLVTCANVAGLLLARSGRRARELSIRSALGAGRRHLVQQTLTESFILATAGAVGGLLLGGWALAAMVASIPEQQRVALPQVANLSLDASMVAIAFGLAFVSGILAGLPPAWRAAGVSLGRGLGRFGRGVMGRARETGMPRHGLPSARPMLVAAEVTMAVALVAGAGVMGKSVIRLLRVSPGFDPTGVLTMAVSVPNRYDTADELTALHRDLLERVSALPGVVAAGTINQLPFRGAGNSGAFHLTGEPLATGETAPEVGVRTVSADYFAALGVPILTGRAFMPEDTPGASVAVLVNQALARRYFPQRGPLGRRITLSRFRDGQPVEIVGIVGNERFVGPDQPASPVVYFLHRQAPESEFRLVVRAAVPPLSLIRPIRAEAAALDPDLPVYEISTMNEITKNHRAVYLRRFVLLMVGCFGALTLALAALGLYGVMAELVGERTPEIGVRVALGATPGSIVRMVLRDGLAPALAGLIAGSMVALGTLRYLRGLLYEVQPHDPSVLSGVALLLGAVIASACWLPARRAARVDPTVSLRAD